MDDHPTGSPQGPGGQNPAYKLTHRHTQEQAVSEREGTSVPFPSTTSRERACPVAQYEAVQRNAEMARDYLEWQRRRNRARETMFIYTDVVQKFLRWIGDTPLAAVPIGTVEAFIERPRLRRRPEHARGQVLIGSPATRKRDVTILRTLYRYLTDRGHISHNPALLLTSPTVHNIEPKAIPDETWVAVWHSKKLDDAERLVLGLGYFCGLRRAEIVNLSPANVDLSGQRLTGFTRKGGLTDTFPFGSAVRLTAERLPRLLGNGPESFLEPLERLATDRQGFRYLLPWGDALGRPDDPRLKGRERKDNFPAGWTPPHVINKRLRRTLTEAGLPASIFTPHSLRHSAISNWLRMGLAIHDCSRLSAHADIGTTMRYVQVQDDPFSNLISDPIPRPNRW